MNGLTDNFLFSVFSLSFLAGLAILFVPEKSRFLPQKAAFYLSLPVVSVAFVSYVLFRIGFRPELFNSSVPLGKSLNLAISLGADNFSMFFILLSALFLPVAVLISRHAKRMNSFFYFSIFLICASAAGLFSSQDFFIFLFFWELSAFPLFFLSGIWGRQDRITASRQFIAFHLLSSLLLFLGILYVADNAHYLTGKWMFSFKDIAAAGLSPQSQFYAFCLFGAAFIFRIPVFPFHTWFTAMSAENQPAGNIYLSGIFVPSGIYAFYKIAILLFPAGAAVFAPFVPYLLAAACLYASLMAWASPSLSSMLSYTLSLNYTVVLMALFSAGAAAISASAFHIVSLSIVSAAAFSLAGALESRSKTLVFSDFGIVSVKEAKFSVLMIITFFSLAGLPCFGGFAGLYGIERIIFASAPVAASIVLASLLLSFSCCIYALGKIISFGGKRQKTAIKSADFFPADLNLNEFLVIMPLAAILLFAGLMPGKFADIFLSDGQKSDVSVNYNISGGRNG